MAQGQDGAWCKVGESGGSSESLLRQCQTFLVPFSFVIGLGEGCSGTVFLTIPGRRWPVPVTEHRGTCHTRAAGGSVSCRNIWQVGRSLVSIPPTALLHCGICSSVSGCSGQSSPRYCGRGFRLPRACSETILQLW